VSTKREVHLEVTTKELRIQPGRIIEHVSNGQEVTVTYRGKPLARIIPFLPLHPETESATIFGMWKDRLNGDSVEDQVRQMRKGRKF
jgi:prevent-host-death family protein